MYFREMEKPDKPNLDKRIFWDVKFEELDYHRYANFIIERVFERGDVEDIRQTRRFYGDEKVKEALLKAKYIPEHKWGLIEAIVDKEIKHFRCYKTKQSYPGLWPY
jgi:hypothetical protein